MPRHTPSEQAKNRRAAATKRKKSPGPAKAKELLRSAKAKGEKLSPRKNRFLRARTGK